MTQAKLFELFRSGTFTPMQGTTISFSDNDIALMATVYNKYKKTPAHLRLGHPPEESENYGEVTKLKAIGDRLLAVANVSDPLTSLVRQGYYKHVSAGFVCGPPQTPEQGVYLLDHVAFLGAQPPAVKGLAPLNFSESDGFLCFSSGSELYTGPAAAACVPAGYTVDAASQPLYQLACDVHRAFPGMSFAEAARHAEEIIFD